MTTAKQIENNITEIDTVNMICYSKGMASATINKTTLEVSCPLKRAPWQAPRKLHKQFDTLEDAKIFCKIWLKA